MQAKDFSKFASYLAGVALTFDRELKSEQIALYFEVLKDEFESIEEFKEAANRLLKSWRYSYMPKPAHFIEALKEEEEDLEVVALKAYNTAKRAAIEIGVYENLEFEDPLIAETILTLFRSFKEFHDHVAYSDSDDTWTKRDFIKTYTRLARNKRVRKRELIGYLQEEFQNPIKIFCDYKKPKVLELEPIAQNVLDKLPKPKKMAVSG